ncbi:MAG: hypothetical protein LBR53_04630 [Deltaproteobacteria bacterium]|jgi:hypothetical protein|nr:hypothetical protein [Deltaproteobacteria bacterium]
MGALGFMKAFFGRRQVSSSQPEQFRPKFRKGEKREKLTVEKNALVKAGRGISFIARSPPCVPSSPASFQPSLSASTPSPSASKTRSGRTGEKHKHFL